MDQTTTREIPVQRTVTTALVVRPRPGPTLQQRVQDMRVQLEDLTRREPVKVLAGSLVAGFAVGLLLRFALRRPRYPSD